MNPWGAGIVVGLVAAAALLVIPRQTFFESSGRDACEAIGQEFVGLDSDSGRYADPVPNGARCVGVDGPAVTEIDVNFFADSGGLDTLLGWLYRLACILVPLGIGLVLGFRLSRPTMP